MTWVYKIIQNLIQNQPKYSATFCSILKTSHFYVKTALTPFWAMLVKIRLLLILASRHTCSEPASDALRCIFVEVETNQLKSLKFSFKFWLRFAEPSFMGSYFARKMLSNALVLGSVNRSVNFQSYLQHIFMPKQPNWYLLTFRAIMKTLSFKKKLLWLNFGQLFKKLGSGFIKQLFTLDSLSMIKTAHNKYLKEISGAKRW